MPNNETLPPQCTLPSLSSILLEARAPFEFASLGLSLPSLRGAPKGDGRPVLLVPGYLANDYSMGPLGRYLKYLGYDVHYAEIGRNMGNINEQMLRLGERLEAVSGSLKNEALTLIGWSLGGVLVREAARLLPFAVREVITMGTPIIGGPKFTTVGKIYARRRALDLDEFELHVHRRNSIGLKQPITSIYSKTDGVVGWQASVDIYNKQAKNIEVNSSHLGLGVHPQVWKIIANTLTAKV
ncbi:MAG: hypothetical protein ACI965_001360 [Paraglaciecola sp.]|jgi:hypothetical protein